MLQFTFAGADRAAVFRRAVAGGFLPDGPPSDVTVDGKRVRSPGDLADLVAAAADLGVSWGETSRLESNAARDHLYLDRAGREVTPEGTLALVRDWPFETALINKLDPTWWADYRALHGWGFIVKGAGHRLISPRVIDRGPWRRLRDEDADVTLFQFHDLAADAETALAQARPGHALLDFMWRGGHYAGQRWAFQSGARAVPYKPSFYDPKARASIVLVQDREVPEREIALAAGTKIHQVYPEPVEQVRYVFMDEEAARRHLPILWLYGLEVRAMTAAGERRIDEEYAPPPPPAPPAWVSAARRT